MKIIPRDPARAPRNSANFIVAAHVLALALAMTGARPAFARPAFAADDEDAAAETPPAAAPAVATPSMKVVRVLFRGNRKVEDDAIKVNLKTQPGVSLTQEMLRDDVRTIWKMGFFEDVQIESTESKAGLVIVFVLKEKPAINKIYVAGNDEVSLSKINEILDVKKEQILDPSKLKKNVEKIKELYVEKGFYMAEVSYELKRNSPSEVDVWFRIHENAKVEVRRVNFVGNHAIGDDELRDVILTHEGNILSIVTQAGTYREDVFQRDLLLLQAHYWDRGYVQVKVGTPLIELSPDKQSMYITISIDEGPQYRLGKIDIRGDLLESKEFFLKRVTVKPGEIFNRSKLSDDLQKLTDLYKDHGYAYVNASPATPVDEKTLTVDVTFEIQKGELVYFDRINIRGNSKTRDKVIRRELRIIEGDAYNQSLLDYSKRRVNALGFFEKVDVSTKRGSSDNEMDVNVEVTERPTGTFQIGAGFSSVENFIAQAQISQNNLLGRGQLLTLQAQISSLRQLFLAAVPGPLLPRHQLDLRLQPLQAGPHPVVVHAVVGGREPHLGLPARRGSAPPADVHARGRARDDRRLRRPVLERPARPDPARVDRQPLAVGRDVVGAIAASRTTRATTACSRRAAGTTRCRPRSPITSWRRRTSSRATRARRASSIQSGGRSSFASRSRAGSSPAAIRTACPIFERYFVGGIYDIRGFAPRSLGPVIQSLSQQTQDAGLQSFLIGGNMQVLGQRRDRVPDLRQGRHPRRRVHRHGQRVQPRGSVLQAAAVERRRQQGSLQGAVRHRRLPRELGLRLSLVLADRPAALRVGHSVPNSAGRAADRVRVHDRELLLIWTLDGSRTPREELGRQASLPHTIGGFY